MLVVEVVLEKITTLLIEEAQLLGNICREIEELRDDLETMKSFLFDAEERSENDQGVRTWVNQVREAAYDVEDVLEEFFLKLKPSQKSPGFFQTLFKNYHKVRNLTTRHRIAARIEDAKKNIRAIALRRIAFGFTRIDNHNQTWNDPRRDSLFLTEADVVGIEHPRETLISWLVDGGEDLTAISVVGMGGLGKTTLVKKTYDSHPVKVMFDCRAWIVVSNSFSVVELLQAALKGFLKSMKQPVPDAIDRMSDIELVSRLKDLLQSRRYIVVFDDVWNSEAWHALKFAFPDSKCGSRILLTTRISDVARSINTTSNVYHLHPLAFNESWALFCMKAFQGKHRGVCPEELKEISLSLLKKCEGLPLAIVTIAGLLSNKNMVFGVWKKIHDSLAAEMKSNASLGNLEKILLLSYKDLPYHLKQCYLYLSVFPEDYLIKRTKMIRLWIAEQLVEAKTGLTMREVAEDYFNELVGRSMIQVVYKSHFKVQACRVHDLMRELIQTRSAQESFAVVLRSGNTLLDKKIRRMSIDVSCKNLPSTMRSPKLRSLLVFIQPGILSLQNTFFHGLKFLRVLDLEGATLSGFPMELTRLIHLRYLSLRRTNLSQLPESISELKSLEFLDLKHSLVTSIPKGILKLENLCQLCCYRYHFRSSIFPETLGMMVPAGISKLTKLQKLNAVDVGKDDRIVTELGYLTDLRRLGILKLKKLQEFGLCASLHKLKQLTDLMVVPADFSEPFEFEPLSCPPQSLQRLIMKCSLPTFPRWIASRQYLTKLVLQYSNSSEDPLGVFQVLPNLVELDLREAYIGEELCCDTGGFPMLKKLSIADMRSLRCVNVAKGSMDGLKELNLVYCENLEKVPEGIEHLRDLQDLLIVSMPGRFLRRLDGPNGEDFEKVKHIQTVKVLQ